MCARFNSFHLSGEHALMYKFGDSLEMQNLEKY
jgi:hypothetical protein